MKKRLKILLYVCLSFFILLNGACFYHAYILTHFNAIEEENPKKFSTLSNTEKIKKLFFGYRRSKPKGNAIPSMKYQTITLESNKKIEGWWIPSDASKESIVLFHGYSGEKSSMLDKAMYFYGQGYSVLLIDFMGSGGSEGIQTSLGYWEADQVKTAFEYASKKSSKVFLFGTSMGAVAILRAISTYGIEPKACILECPFGTLREAVENRFSNYHIPSVPFTELLVFWGGIINDFPGFEHNPREYASSSKIPTLLMYGEKDTKVKRSEIDAIYKNLKGKKQLVLFPEAAHENYLTKYSEEWQNALSAFLLTLEN